MSLTRYLLTLKLYSGQILDKIVLIYFLKNTSLDLSGARLGYFSKVCLLNTHTFFLTQFHNVKWVKKKLLNHVFGSKMGTHRNEWEKLKFRAF